MLDTSPLFLQVKNMSYELELLGQIEQEMEKLASIHGAITDALMQKQANAVTELPMRAVSALKAKGQQIAGNAEKQIILNNEAAGGTGIPNRMLNLKYRAGQVLDNHAGKIVAGGGALGVGGVGLGGYELAKSASEAPASKADALRAVLAAHGVY